MVGNLRVSYERRLVPVRAASSWFGEAPTAASCTSSPTGRRN